MIEDLRCTKEFYYEPAILNFSDEVILDIFFQASFENPSELLNCSLVCKRWFQLSSDHCLAKKIYRYYFPEIDAPLLQKNDNCGILKNFYKNILNECQFVPKCSELLKNLTFKNINQDILKELKELIELHNLEILCNAIGIEDAPQTITNAEKIEFYKEKIKEISDKLPDEGIKINSSGLTRLPPEIKHFSKITYLDLKENHLVSLPSEIKHLEELKILDLSRNRITHLCPEMSQLSKLCYIQLNDNNLRQVPEVLTKVLNLFTLHLANNQLESLPKTLDFSFSLNALCLNNNKLNDFPETILKITSLRFLNLDNNRLISLPAEIAYLKNLSHLSIKGNPIECIPESILDLELSVESRKDINRYHSHVDLMKKLS